MRNGKQRSKAYAGRSSTEERAPLTERRVSRRSFVKTGVIGTPDSGPGGGTAQCPSQHREAVGPTGTTERIPPRAAGRPEISSLRCGASLAQQLWVAGCDPRPAGIGSAERTVNRSLFQYA